MKGIKLLGYRLRIRKSLQESNDELLKITKEELEREWQRRFNKKK